MRDLVRIDHAKPRSREGEKKNIKFALNFAASRLCVILFTLMLFPASVYSIDNPPARGDAAVAERYAIWIKNLIDNDRWSEAHAALERAWDFADVSSDISYMLALARSRQGRPRGEVINALNMAIGIDRWVLFQREQARLFRAEQLIKLRAFQQALNDLELVSISPRQAELSLQALSLLRPIQFRALMTETLDRFPRETAPVRILFNFFRNEEISGRNPTEEDLELLALVLRRLPALLLNDPELAWMAAPYVWDINDARRLVLAYRAIHTPAPASIPVALRLGIISEETAIEELFNSAERTPIDIALLDEVWELLRSESAQELFRRNLSVFTGFITEDRDRDGIPETFARYYSGILVFSSYDINQEGIPDLSIFFEGNVPQRASVLVPPGRSSPGGTGFGPLVRQTAEITWEIFPAILEVELDGARFIPRPMDFHFSPIRFVGLWGSGLLFPQRDQLAPALTRRVLVYNTLRVERPSPEFNEGIEIVELSAGVPIRAREFVDGRLVSETEFQRGRPVLQRVDITLDGRMNILRRFAASTRPMELEELWDYDRNVEFVEEIGEWGIGSR